MSTQEQEPHQGPIRSRRYTTMEGWRDLGEGFYNTAGLGIRFLDLRNQFDFEQHHEGGSAPNLSSTSLATSPTTVRPPLYQTKSWPGDGIPGAVEEKVRDDAPSEKESPYHTFSPAKKRAIICLIGAAGLFSGLSSNIYFPALDQISRSLNITISLANLTITSYLIAQGLSPLLWGPLSDTVGRRPIYIYSFLVYIIANIGLSFSPNFAVLFAFRALQAAGSASTVSIGNGVIQDLCPPAERGGYVSFYQAIRNFSIAIGPVLGGLLSNFLGFRSIFIFLSALSGVVFLILLVFLPETLRDIAGNGSIQMHGIHQSIAARLRHKHLVTQGSESPPKSTPVTLATFLEPLKLLAEKDILTSLIFGGIVYAIWSMVTSSTTSLFKSQFGLGQILLGLAFIPNGLGTIVGSAIVGNLMNYDFRLAEQQYKIDKGLPSSYKLSKKDLPADFPLEQARLRNFGWIVAFFVLTTAIYGFTLAVPSLISRQGWIAVPLTLQFFIAGSSNAVFAVNQTLVSDLCPGKGASGTAINNLVRCSLGAIGVAFVERMILVLGVGPAFLSLALITVVSTPLIVAQWYLGMRWRMQRLQRQEKSVDKSRA